MEEMRLYRQGSSGQVEVLSVREENAVAMVASTARVSKFLTRVIGTVTIPSLASVRLTLRQWEMEVVNESYAK